MAVVLVHEGKVFEDQTVYLSGNAYFDCSFSRCVLVFRGDAGPITGCSFQSCVWHLDMVVSDHQAWEEFLTVLAPMISKSLPRPPGKAPG